MVRQQSAPRPIEPGDPLETLVADIWERCLGRRPDDVRTSFAALGGTPDLAAGMIEELEQAVATPLGPRTVPLDVTIESLASLLRRRAGGGAAPRPHFVRNARGTAPPLFFLHGDYRGGGLYCVTLAARLGHEQPLYAIAPLGMDGGPVPSGIVAMASRHVDALRALRPRGPYRLGGHCAGAVIAFEMARQLRAGGDEVDALIMVAPLLGPGQFGRPARILAAMGWLRARMSAEASLRRCTGRLRWLMRQPAGTRIPLLRDRLATGLAGRRSADPPAAPLDGSPGAAERAADLWRLYGEAMWGYCPADYDGPLTVIQPGEETGAGAARVARAWATVAPRVQVRVVPGTHLGCITTHVAALAVQMRACLADRRETGAPAPRG